MQTFSLFNGSSERCSLWLRLCREIYVLDKNVLASGKPFLSANFSWKSYCMFCFSSDINHTLYLFASLSYSGIVLLCPTVIRLALIIDENSSILYKYLNYYTENWSDVRTYKYTTSYSKERSIEQSVYFSIIYLRTDTILLYSSTL